MTEIWNTIEGYPNYQVSNLGRVKSLGNDKKRKEKILKGGKDIGGYFYVILHKDGKRKYFKVHRLVASAFLDNPNNYPIINHINEIKNDNRVDNLEWCTCQYNNNYGTRNERLAKSHSIPILQFSKTGEFIKKWESAREVERELGFNHRHISSCCKGKRKSGYGFKWGYAKDYQRIPFKVFDLDIYEKKVA